MSLLDDINFTDDFWLHLESPMFSMVDPNDICPSEVLTISYRNDNQSLNVMNQLENLESATAMINQHERPTLKHPSSIQTWAPKQEHPQLVVQSTPNIVNEYHSHILNESPPLLTSCDDTKSQIQQRIQLHRALSQQRQDQLKAQLDKQPPPLPMAIMRKVTGKKMSNRERQLELERQEAELLKLRDHHLDLIHQLERKCNKLREILENIVTTSPEYNAQMINFLESSELLVDKRRVSGDDRNSLDENRLPVLVNRNN